VDTELFPDSSGTQVDKTGDASRDRERRPSNRRKPGEAPWPGARSPDPVGLQSRLRGL